MHARSTWDKYNIDLKLSGKVGQVNLAHYWDWNWLNIIYVIKCAFLWQFIFTFLWGMTNELFAFIPDGYPLALIETYECPMKGNNPER